MKKVVLCILDGFGVREALEHNGIAPYALKFQALTQQYAYTELEASQEYVGLPKGQMGNSEVGHMTIGLGRVIYQDLVRIENEFDSIKNHAAVSDALAFLKQNQGSCHVMGLLSDGGVHSHENHIHLMIEHLLNHNVPVSFHAFLDGRDTPPASAIGYMEKLLLKFSTHPLFSLSTISGRYYAMDRDQRLDRTEKALSAILHAQGVSFLDPIQYIKDSYESGIHDEFVLPGFNANYKGVDSSKDIVWMANFRADRVRQILRAFMNQNVFKMALGFHTYAPELEGYVIPLLEKEDTSVCLGSVISDNGLSQLRVGETEKYAHVTFFFNAGKDAAFKAEDRILVPSPSVATYDLDPCMSADQVLKNVTDSVTQHQHDLIVVNFANPDMVGHTGIESAIIQAIKKIDDCVQELANCCLLNDYALIITADHGNAEEMYDTVHNQPHTAHTLNKVPFVLVDSVHRSLQPGGSLKDIAPTILDIMEIDVPEVMTGKILIKNFI